MSPRAASSPSKQPILGSGAKRGQVCWPAARNVKHGHGGSVHAVSMMLFPGLPETFTCKMLGRNASFHCPVMLVRGTQARPSTRNATEWGTCLGPLKTADRKGKSELTCSREDSLGQHTDTLNSDSAYRYYFF